VDAPNRPGPLTIAPPVGHAITRRHYKSIVRKRTTGGVTLSTGHFRDRQPHGQRDYQRIDVVLVYGEVARRQLPLTNDRCSAFAARSMLRITGDLRHAQEQGRVVRGGPASSSSAAEESPGLSSQYPRSRNPCMMSFQCSAVKSGSPGMGQRIPINHLFQAQ
jgi:hypothetical protein